MYGGAPITSLGTGYRHTAIEPSPFAVASRLGSTGDQSTSNMVAGNLSESNTVNLLAKMLFSSSLRK